MFLIRWFRRSLTAKFLVAFTAAVLVGIGGVAILANQRTAAALPQYRRVHAPDADGKPIAPIMRIHSQCLTADVFHSLRCDCRQPLELALATIADARPGILLYETQEVRAIGLRAKIQPYGLRDQGGTATGDHLALR